MAKLSAEAIAAIENIKATRGLSHKSAVQFYRRQQKKLVAEFGGEAPSIENGGLGEGVPEIKPRGDEPPFSLVSGAAGAASLMCHVIGEPESAAAAEHVPETTAAPVVADTPVGLVANGALVAGPAPVEPVKENVPETTVLKVTGGATVNPSDPASVAAAKENTKARKDSEFAAKAVELFKGGMKVSDVAVALGYPKGQGNNRVRNALIAAGVYTKKGGQQ